ncbi:hypothetical protein, partial [Helicobacter sp. MIT 14-3879]|uniref:hypothetical protein n=1 Tax=Helicobacter sp. MIT 14-3879 TaxID=2040649 RepID=UPI000E36BA52
IDNDIPYIQGILKVSHQFCVATKLQNNDKIILQIETQAVSVVVQQDTRLKGMVAILCSKELRNSKKYFDYKKA